MCDERLTSDIMNPKFYMKTCLLLFMRCIGTKLSTNEKYKLNIRFKQSVSR